MIAFLPPSHRWVRLRHWMRVPQARIGHEVHTVLRLPGFVVQPDTVVAAILIDAPEPPKALHLISLDGGKATKKTGRVKPPKRAKPRRKVDELAWMDPDLQTKQDEYARAHRLDYYTSKPGVESMKNAMALWLNPYARELICGMLIAGRTPGEISKVCKARVPGVKAAECRPVDIDTYQDLLWDMRDWSVSEKSAFLKHHPAYYLSSVAATQGVDAVLFRLGLGSMQMTRLDAVRKVQELAYAQMRGWQFKPELVSPSELATIQNVLISSWAAEDQIQAQESDPADMLMSMVIDVTPAEEIPGYLEILEDVTMQQTLEDIASSYNAGLISAEVADMYRRRTLDGEDLDVNLHEMLAVHLKKAVASAGTEEDDVFNTVRALTSGTSK